jgi:hypothetical protein
MNIRIFAYYSLLLFALSVLFLESGCSRRNERANTSINRGDAAKFAATLNKKERMHAVLTALNRDNTRTVEFYEGTMDGLEWRAIRLVDQFGNSADAMICINTGKVSKQAIPRNFEKVDDPTAHWR